MKLFGRIYEDYFKKSRLPYYKQLLQCAKKQGYAMVGVLDFYKIVQEYDFMGDKKIKLLVNRHDIDTSPKIARQMFYIEKYVYGQQGSVTYYFRNSTIDRRLIREIEQYGYETGYHYEEIADYGKKYRIKTGEELKNCLPAIREKFVNDLKKYRLYTETNSFSVASHGDFLNIKYHMPNTMILEDKAIRKQSGIKIEAYDECIMKYVEARFADQILLEKFHKEVIDEMNKGTSIIMILTHPRNWKVDIAANTKENLKRLIQGIQYGV